MPERPAPRHGKAVAAAVHAAKIEVAQLIGKTLKARKLTQKFAADIMQTDQARISAMARGDVAATSFEKLLRCLMLLGWDANIAIARRPAGRRGKIAIIAETDHPSLSFPAEHRIAMRGEGNPGVNPDSGACCKYLDRSYAVARTPPIAAARR